MNWKPKHNVSEAQREINESNRLSDEKKNVEGGSDLYRLPPPPSFVRAYYLQPPDARAISLGNDLLYNDSCSVTGVAWRTGVACTNEKILRINEWLQTKFAVKYIRQKLVRNEESASEKPYSLSFSSWFVFWCW